MPKNNLGSKTKMEEIHRKRQCLTCCTKIKNNGQNYRSNFLKQMAEKTEKLGASFSKAVGGKLKLKGVEFKGYEFSA